MKKREVICDDWIHQERVKQNDDNYCPICGKNLKESKPPKWAHVKKNKQAPVFEFSGKAVEYHIGVAVDTDGLMLSNDKSPHKAYTLEKGVNYTVKLFKD